MKNTNYCIIDHIGALESNEVMKACYKLAFEISEKKATYTMKGFCQKISRNPNTKVSDKQKNFVRFNKHPEEVVLICNDFNTSAQWIADVWAEKTDKLTVIEASTMEILTLEDIHPEWFALNDTNSIYRRCANIWANALGWTFSAPLYRDNKQNSSENYTRNNTMVRTCAPHYNETTLLNAERLPKEYFKHADGSIGYRIKPTDGKFHYVNTEKEDLSKFSKVATRPESYLRTKAVASEEECKQFFNHYRFLQQNDMLADSLEPGYELCPHCHRPIFESAEDCDWCDFHRDAPMNFTPYFDDSYRDEDWDQLPLLSFSQEVIMKVLQSYQNLRLVLDNGKYKIMSSKKVLFETTSIDLAYELFQKGV